MSQLMHVCFQYIQRQYLKKKKVKISLLQSESSKYFLKIVITHTCELFIYTNFTKSRSCKEIRRIMVNMTSYI